MVWKDYPLTEIGHEWARPAAMANNVYIEKVEMRHFSTSKNRYSQTRIN